MAINKEIMQKHDQLLADLEAVKELHSEQIKTVQAQFGDNDISITRDDGKTIVTTEKALWDEVYYLGADSEAGKLMQEKYPDIFASAKKQNEIAGEYRKFIVDNFGVDYTAMTFGAYLKVLDMMVDYKLSQKND